MAENLPAGFEVVSTPPQSEELPDGFKPVSDANSPAAELEWSDVPGEMVANFGDSLKNFIGDFVSVFTAPIQTAKNIRDLGYGVVAKLVPGEQPEEEIANAVGQFLADRYGGLDEIKNTMATDPVGIAADLSMILTGGGSLAARAPGMAGKLGSIAAKAGSVLDPIAGTAKAVSGIGKVAAPAVLGTVSGVGDAAVKTAAAAGAKGEQFATAFLENLRGKAPMTQVVSDARAAIAEMKRLRRNAYLNGMAGVTSDPSILRIGPIYEAVQRAKEVGQFKGVTTKPSAAKVINEIEDIVIEWAKYEPSEFHTVEGLDALKQKIGDVRDATAYGTPERSAANAVYGEVRSIIDRQAPDYARVMSEYEEASSLLREIEGTLVSGDTAKNVDTALRRLQSIMRNNVNTNYGRRAELAQELVDAGAKTLPEQLAGQALSSWRARGLQQLMALPTIGAGYYDPSFFAALPMQVPRLVGEGAYYTGKAAPYVGNTIRYGGLPVYQAGRTSGLLEDQ